MNNCSDLPVKKPMVNSFFAGIGGFDLGFEKANFQTAYQCEINKYCIDILNKHWPAVQRDKDINMVALEHLPDAEIWCGGFPCQDLSVASGTPRAGLNGSRSGLFLKFAELIQAKKPKVVLLENVTGLLNSNDGRDFRIVLENLIRFGYAVSWRVLNSCYFGVPQSRPRVYICGWLSSPSNAAHVLFDRRGAVKPPNLRLGFMQPAKTQQNDTTIVPQTAFCLAATSGRHTGTDWSRTYPVCRNGVRRMTPLECENIQGFPPEWTLPTSGEFGTIDDVDTLRYTALGNAVSVPVISWIAKRIYDGLLGHVLPLPIAKGEIKEAVISALSVITPEFNSAKTRKEIVLDDIHRSDFETTIYEWPRAGIVWDGICIGGALHPTPPNIIETHLADFIEKDVVDERYYLSPNAAEGILRRVHRQKRKLFGPLHDELVRLSNKKNNQPHEDAI